MSNLTLDSQLLLQLVDIPEIAAAGFTIREGLTGAGVTILKGRSYFGSWRVAAGKLVWVNASASSDNEYFETADEAARHTLLLILRSLEARQSLSGPDLRSVASR